jgi:hypothetical protein
VFTTHVIPPSSAWRAGRDEGGSQLRPLSETTDKDSYKHPATTFMDSITWYPYYDTRYFYDMEALPTELIFQIVACTFANWRAPRMRPESHS